MHRHLLIVAVLFISSCSAPVHHNGFEQPQQDSASFASASWTPDKRVIADLESKITFPNPTGYARYYSGRYFATGERLIKGEMVKPKRTGDRPPGIYIVPPLELPFVRDGTCDVVHIDYAVEPAEIILNACGGGPL